MLDGYRALTVSRKYNPLVYMLGGERRSMFICGDGNDFVFVPSPMPFGHLQVQLLSFFGDDDGSAGMNAELLESVHVNANRDFRRSEPGQARERFLPLNVRVVGAVLLRPFIYSRIQPHFPGGELDGRHRSWYGEFFAEHDSGQVAAYPLYRRNVHVAEHDNDELVIDESVEIGAEAIHRAVMSGAGNIIGE